jgi:hypothetical protein
LVCSLVLSGQINQHNGENKMNNLSSEAKELINDLLEKGHSPNDIKLAMEDGEYLAEAYIPQELSEEVHSFLSSKRIYEAMVSLCDFSGNEIKTIKVAGIDEKDIMDTVNMIIDESNDSDIFYGKIRNFCAIK